MRTVLLAALVLFSCAADKQPDEDKCWVPFVGEAPQIEMPTADADGRFTADQINKLSVQIDAVRLYEQRVTRALAQYAECRVACGYPR